MECQKKIQRIFSDLPPFWQDAARVAFIAVAYFVAHFFSFLFPDTEKVLMAVWPAGGIGLASLLLNPRRLWPVIIIALFLAGNVANLSVGRPLFSSVGFMTANILESIGCAWLIIRINGEQVNFSRINEILALIAAAIFANAATSCIGAGTAWFSGVTSFGEFWLTWWVADALGILLITPLIVTTFRAPAVLPERPWVEWGLFFFIWCTLSWLTFRVYPSSPLYTPQPYLLFALLAWPALRYGPRGVIVALFLLTVVAISSQAVQTGPLIWGGETRADRMIFMQMYLAVLAITGYLLTASFHQAKVAEQVAIGERKKLTILGDNLPYGMTYQVVREHDGSMRFLYVSAGVERIHGVSAAAVLADPGTLYRQIVEEDQHKVASAKAESGRNMVPFDTIARLRRADGKLRWVHLSSSPRLLEDGRILWDGIETDITEAKLAEERVAKERENFLATFAAAPVGLLLLDSNTIITEANRTAVNLVLREPAEVIGKRAGGGLGCIHSLEDAKGCGFGASCSFCPLRTAIESVLENGRSIQGAEVNSTLLIDGVPRERWLRVNVEPIELDNKKHLIVAIDDITEQKQATEALKKSEERFRLVADYAYDCETWLSPEGKLLYISPSCKSSSGYTRDDFYRAPGLLETIVHPADQEQFRMHHSTLLPGAEKACEFDFRIICKNGEVKQLSHICQAVFSDEGKYLGRRGSNRDITERRALEKELQRFKNTLDQAHDCVFMFSAETLRFSYANQGAIDQVGYTAEELQQMTPLDIKPQFTEKSFREILTPLINKKKPLYRFETVHKHKDGTIIPVDILLQHIAPEGEEGVFVAIVRDISERKALENKLREYGVQQRTLLQEVNHRVKNNLTAIISMLHQEEDRAAETGRPGDASQLKEVVGRVKGLLIVHSLLSASKWKPLHLTQLCQEVICGTIAGLADAQALQFDVDSSNTLVNADQAHSLALVLNEAATNTVKYGCKPFGTASIHVSIENSEGEIHLTCRDNGPGFPETVLQGHPPRGCIGVKMISGIIRKSMGGEVKLRNEGGAVMNITFPEYDRKIEKLRV